MAKMDMSKKEMHSKSAKPKHAIRRFVVEPSDNGGFISRTERPMPMNGPYEDRDEKNVHAGIDDLVAHLKKTFPPKAGGAGKAPAPKRAQSDWAKVGDQMLGKG